MKKVFMSLLVALCGLVIIGCHQQEITIVKETPLKTGITPSETISIVEDTLLGIYMPISDESIEESVYKLSPIATKEFTENLLSEVGRYDEEKRASVRNMKIDIGVPENMASPFMKIIARFTVTRGEDSRNILVEFRCNTNDEIINYSVWSSSV